MTSMTVLETGVKLLKTDCLGRVRTGRARREAILDEFERSGGSGAEFAALLGIKYPTFASWIQGRRRQRRERQRVEGEEDAMVSAAPKSAPVWLEAVLENGASDLRVAASSAESCAGVVRVRLPGGAEVELTHAGQVRLLAGLLRELDTRESSPC